MTPNLNCQLQRFLNHKKLVKPRWMKDRQVKVVNLFASDAINRVMESLNAKQKLFCDICATTKHLIGRCILKQPRLLAHSCGYNVNGLGFYHVPHAPITFGKANNTSVLVTVQGGTLMIQQTSGRAW
jgi:hypothetical protein